MATELHLPSPPSTLQEVQPSCIPMDRGFGVLSSELLGHLITCAGSSRSSTAPSPHPSGCCASSQDHPLLPATMNSWTSSAFLQSTMLQRELHSPCCLWKLCSDPPEFPSPDPLHRDPEMLHAGSPSSVPWGSSDTASPSRSPIERRDRCPQRNLP